MGADGQQFFDVVNLLEKIGLPSEKHMIVFNGKQQLLDDRCGGFKLTNIGGMLTRPERMYKH